MFLGVPRAKGRGAGCRERSRKAASPPFGLPSLTRCPVSHKKPQARPDFSAASKRLSTNHLIIVRLADCAGDLPAPIRQLGETAT
jgi:hypothetical protein